MKLDGLKKSINDYLKSSETKPIIVDIQSRKELSLLMDYFNIGIGNNKPLKAGDFCDGDNNIKIDELYHSIDSSDNSNYFLLSLSPYLKVLGMDTAKNILNNLVNKNVNGHLVIITYQCKSLLKFPDPRIADSGRVLIASGEPDAQSKVCFVSKELLTVFDNCVDGYGHFGEFYESSSSQIVYVATNVSSSSFPNSMLQISQLTDGYDILCKRDDRTSNVPKHLGTQEQWNYVLEIMGADGDWNTIVDSRFGSVSELPHKIKYYSDYAPIDQWLYYTCVSIFGLSSNYYLKLAVENSSNYSELITSMFRTILNIDMSSPNFNILYDERKELLSNFSNLHNEYVDYCKVVSAKGKDIIYYLTDLSQPEKEKVIYWLDKYGDQYQSENLEHLLLRIYPDLALYISKFDYKNELLNDYFAAYKYQKLINTVLPSFETIVDEQSSRLDFVSALKTRSSVVDKLDLSNAKGFFVDALGVEYLSYIQLKCREYGLKFNSSCARSKLPSLTCFNKEFVQTFTEANCLLADIKELDEVKHHGENNFDYQKVQIPLYLIKELEIIDKLIKQIKSDLVSNQYSKAVIVSDHGASRLAVLHDTENIWSMATKGVHSGRCCPKSEIDTKPSFAIEEDDFWILANYDRFKGSRKANCEVHGGATIEEVAVPIIELSLDNGKTEAFIVDKSKVQEIGAKECPIVYVYVSNNNAQVTASVNGDYYAAIPTDEDYIYRFELTGISKKGIYNMDIIVDSNIVTKADFFEVKKKGLSENSLFD